MKLLHVQVLTPLQQVVDGLYEEVVAPLPDGWIGVSVGHAPFLARLMRGQVALRGAEGQRSVATIGGTITVNADSVILLTGAAALETDFSTLELMRGQEGQELHTVEQEAEKHFERVYRSLARTLNQQRRGVR